MSYDYLPIIAHAERYDCFFQERKRLHRIKEHGALLQVNGETLLGSFMDEMSQRGKYMVKQDLVDFLATDAHGSMGRSPRLQKSAAYLYKKLGREKAEKIILRAQDDVEKMLADLIERKVKVILDTNPARMKSRKVAITMETARIPPWKPPPGDRWPWRII